MTDSVPNRPDPRNWWGMWARLLMLGALFFGLFATVLLPDFMPGWLPERNFIYRDAGHFYYPYFAQIQAQWNDGRIPLWDPHDSGGLPLAANPTASVFYPLKAMFFWLPYPTAYRWYLAGHVLLATLVMYGAARGFGVSSEGAFFASLAYAFGGFVLFQIYNVVFLVGATWLPLALLAIDRLVRGSDIRWALALGVALALQVLGGDPQLALLEGIAAVPYWLFFHFGPGRGLVLLGLFACVGFGVTNGSRQIPVAVTALLVSNGDVSGFAALQLALVAMLSLFGLVGLFWQRQRLLQNFDARDALSLLLFSGLLALGLSAVQILPTAELVRLTDRAAPEAPHEPVAFSFFPGRMIEWFLPTFWGKPFPFHGRWLGIEFVEAGVWIPTVYMGLLPAILGLAAFRARRGNPAAVWLTWTTILMLWLSLGKFGGVSWLLDANAWQPVDPVTAAGTPTLSGTSDGLYWLCEQVVPGFRAFRYPSKILVVCVASLALLSGMGLDQALADRWKRMGSILLIAAGSGIVACAVLWLARAPLENWFAGRSEANSFGPMSGSYAWSSVAGSVLQASIIAGLAGCLLIFQRRSPRYQPLVASGMILILAFDLYVADRWLILTDLQSEIDGKPDVVKVIEAAQSARGDDQPYRVHRTRIYHPLRWHKEINAARVVEMSRWERLTIQPKYGVLWGVDYTTAVGTMSLYDVEFFFAPWPVTTPPELLQAQPTQRQMVYYPREGYNLWNTRYFVIPKLIRLGDEERGVFTLIADRNGLPGKVLAQSAADQDDFLVIENPEAFPRAWLVHSADVRPPVLGMARKDRLPAMEDLLFRSRDGGLPLWRDNDRREYPLRSTVMLETDDAERLVPYASGKPPAAAEKVRVSHYAPEEIRLEVQAETAGFVVLADAYYPGWTAEVDGQPATLLRANRAMRAVPVAAGTHVVTMRYRSIPFEIGAFLSGFSWIGVAVAGLFLAFRAVHYPAKRPVET